MTSNQRLYKSASNRPTYMKKTNSISYQKTILKLKKISRNGKEKPGKTYLPPDEQPEPANDSPNTNSQTENLPLVCNNIHDQDSEQMHKIHDDNNLPRSLRPHQDQDPIKLKILKGPYDNQILNENSRAAKYLVQEDRIIIKDGLLYRQYF